MDPIDIKATLAKKSVSQTAIAKRFNVSSTAVHLVIFGNGRSKRIERYISQVTGLPLERIWPKWYRQSKTAA